MTVLRFVLGDQLTREVAALADLDPARDVVLMAEVTGEATYVPHHKKKLALVFSAMRHFAEALRAEGVAVDYVRLDAPGNTGTLAGELARAVARHGATRVVATEPGEWRLDAEMRGYEAVLGVPVEIRADDRFFASRARFHAWAAGRKQYRMEFFYREMRRETGILMDGDEPAGGRWNFDAENRSPLGDRLFLPRRPRYAPDAVTREVMDLVAARFPDHFGDLEPFFWPVTRAEALDLLEHFVAVCLPRFGEAQDAMAAGEPFLYHSLLSSSLNLGLLTARETCLAAEAAYRRGEVPIASAEGFIRQILGWREYVRGIYFEKMPDYAETNALGAHRPLPAFYWTGETRMACVAEVVAETRAHAYAHHIERLMVTGTFALLAGLAPKEVEAWYLLVYADAYEWVELPNTHGMALYADGGLLASKPYAASGAYIDRMSDHCGGCAYDVKAKAGAKACPFNRLYWDFLARNRDVLGANPRLQPVYRTYDKLSEARRAEIAADAAAFLAALDRGDRV